ncbi:SDR family oxidoreductase [Kineosporia succinea]|uniref:NAD(P)-dependent dehydrogenase (Short-subunit alcohol dehydrogenase family) n=1 Tax=Kineosporia succinea TaxID=84632 RepID=A0ABT9PC06_9ACTN|nr:SDR family oxidoreductase [Kineosporia succinea]MDP9830226.1 NAD(P)-dependent dehydrogenase (short-subunit alcohol dehydrogenase family) [Kineosporia succinea]
MDLKGAVVLVTGANRGIGAAFVRVLQDRGAGKIYAAARDATTIQADGVEKIALDVTRPGQIEAAARAAGDVQVLINNAGISTGTSLVTGDEASIRREMDTNFYGPLLLTRAFAPILRANGGGAVLNVVSALSWFTAPGAGAYAASKAATWMLTDSTRQELAGQGTHVVGVYMGLVDTDMSKGMQAPKIHPAELAGAGLDAIESGEQEVLADDWARFIKSGLALDPRERYERIGAALSGS